MAVCPQCLASLRVKLEYTGRRVQCKHCNHKFRVFPPDFPLTPSSQEYSAGPFLPQRKLDQMEVACPNCQTLLGVRTKYAGGPVRCRQCHHKFNAPKSPVADSSPTDSPQTAKSSDVVPGFEPPAGADGLQKSMAGAELPDGLTTADSEGLTEQEQKLRRDLTRVSAELAQLQEENRRLRLLAAGAIQPLHQTIEEPTAFDDQLALATCPELGSTGDLPALDRATADLGDDLPTTELAPLVQSAEPSPSPDEVMTILQERDRELAQSRARVEELEHTLLERTQAFDEVTRSLRAELAELRRQLEEVAQDRDRLTAELQRASLEAQQMQQEMTNQRTSLERFATLLAEHHKLTEQVRHLEESTREAERTSQQRIAQLEETADRAVSERDRFQNDLKEHQERILDLEENLKRESELVARLRIDLAARVARHNQALLERLHLIETNNLLQSKLQTSEQARMTAEADLATAREQVAGLVQRLAEAENSLESMASLLKSVGITMNS
jgi:predicted Zn finger-like uncharacterized protein